MSRSGVAVRMHPACATVEAVSARAPSVAALRCDVHSPFAPPVAPAPPQTTTTALAFPTATNESTLLAFSVAQARVSCGLHPAVAAAGGAV